MEKAINGVFHAGVPRHERKWQDTTHPGKSMLPSGKWNSKQKPNRSKPQLGEDHFLERVNWNILPEMFQLASPCPEEQYNSDQEHLSELPIMGGDLPRKLRS